MERRNFLTNTSLLGLLGLAPMSYSLTAIAHYSETKDRNYWVSLLEKIAAPVLDNISKGQLQKNMAVALSPVYGARHPEFAYLEAFARLIAGMAPWLALPDDNTAENSIRKHCREQVLQGLANIANPSSPDHAYWGGPAIADRQPLVEAAYLAQTFLTAPQVFWHPLDNDTKARFIKEFTAMRQFPTVVNNWVLFAAMIESFLLSIDQPFDAGRIDNALEKMSKWYVGDGWYSDGDHFHFDHYNGYVMHPMLVDILKANIAKGRRESKEYDVAYKRMRRYASFQERFISPEGTYPVVGRSSTYRVGAFQPLVRLALEDALPEGIHPAQVRCALTKVMKRMFIPDTFTGGGWLQLGLVGNKQQGLADSYSNTGSMYITSLVFLPLGLQPDHVFWSAPFTEWTQLKAWKGEPVAKDYAVDY